MAIKYLTYENLVAINELVEKPASMVVDEHGLHFIAEGVNQTFAGQDVYPSFWLKAAFYLQRLTKKHCFLNGNKRTALLALDVFLRMNGYHLTLSKYGRLNLILAVTTADDSYKVMDGLSRYLKAFCEKQVENYED